MGLGDELMMAGEARRRAGASSAKFGMTGKRDERRWHFLWEHCEHIARPSEDCAGLVGYVNGRRPYVAAETAQRRTFRAYEPAPAALRLPERAARLAADMADAIVFNPTIKYRAPVNKDWGIERWKALVRLAPELRWVQIGDGSMPRIRGCEQRPTADFLDALGLLSGARAVVLHEGALHHAAAALDVPAIVIRGGYISPKVTGYAGQIDFYVEDARWPLGCGMRIHCLHCERAMASIMPAAVAEALRGLLKKAA